MKEYYVDPHNSIYDKKRRASFVWLDPNGQARLKNDGLTLKIGERFACADDGFKFNAEVSHYDTEYCYLKTDLKW